MPAIIVAADEKANAGKSKSQKSKKIATSASSFSTEKIMTKELIVDAISPEERSKMIADNAYFRAQRRNFSVEGIESDWLDAESEVNSWLI